LQYGASIQTTVFKSMFVFDIVRYEPVSKSATHESVISASNRLLLFCE